MVGTMEMIRKLLTLFIIVLPFVLAAESRGQSSAGDTVLVMPFENRTDMQEFNWVGESFALSVSELLRVPGLNVVTNAERKLLQQRLRMPLTSLPSLASSLRLSREAGATLLITGRYSITPAAEDTAAIIDVTVKIILVAEGRYLSEQIGNRQISRDIVLRDALGNLQSVQGQVAYQILYQRDKALPFSQNQLIESASKVPARAFEAYIKGLLSPAGELRENFLRNAVRLYSESNPESAYAEAALELGHLYLGQRKFNEAIDAFERVVSAHNQCRAAAKAGDRMLGCNDESFAEASFYIGTIQWERGNFEQALAVLRPLAEDLQLTTVYNTLGAIAVQASRAERRNEQNAAALLAEGIALLKTAADSSPDDASIRFNYGYTLFLQKNFIDAATQFRAAIEANPRDGEAFYLLAKSLQALKDESAAVVDDQARTFLSTANRYATLEREWQRSQTIPDIRMRVTQPRRSDFVSVVLRDRRNTVASQPRLSETDNLLAQAREHFKNGNDEEAMAVIRRILSGEPMNAESYLLLGKIHLRRGDREQAMSSFKTALFWDNRQIDAHIALGRIYFERGECLQVKNYAASALEIDPNYSDAISLGRQAERCSK
ncbi:tetratricopeptide repeat protein [Leptolyngbya sp. 7M]|uniref:tetratricopeptide repeat protein n=1 Tax=Leptolyngbya sp. 7M TaxID=2812896 RepID=UPI001B8B0329|nr:tetratricopeptide repeat protein [Leptolyngbya sp. 7M]QYO66212.1 tetratricopeptide repeat protein [Leptolyngbya sp. 7M]